MTRQMLTPVMSEAGLGLFIDHDNPGVFGHNGADEGFQALVTMNAESGKGVAIMANSDNGIAVGDFLLWRVAQEYGWNYKAPGQGAFGQLLLIAKMKGVPAALEQYTELKKSPSAGYKIDEGTLNGLGYTLLSSGQTQDAITVFKRNVHEYPKSANAHDSLGEAYMKANQKDLAIENYERSLQLDPKNQNAVDRLKRLKESK
jgi:tetratricopeptide (TPR) repeat protein